MTCPTAAPAPTGHAGLTLEKQMGDLEPHGCKGLLGPLGSKAQEMLEISNKEGIYV